MILFWVMMKCMWRMGREKNGSDLCTHIEVYAEAYKLNIML